MKRKILIITLLLILICLLTGCFCSHEWKSATCETPERCTKCDETRGEPRGHSWTPATCTAPETCSVCRKTTGLPRGHSWTSATCTLPQQCRNCSATQGEALGHSWQKATKTKPKTCSTCSQMEPMELPKNGKVIIGKKKSGVTNLVVTASASENCYVKLKDKNGKDALAFFVRAGKTVKISVPKKNLYVYFATGDDWYGPELLFGDRTSYSKDSEVANFKKYKVTYSLVRSTSGNFSTTPVSPNEF